MTREEALAKARDLIEKARETGDADFAWDLVDLLHDQMLLED